MSQFNIIPTNQLAHELMTSISFNKISAGAFDLVNEEDKDLCYSYICNLVNAYLEENMLWVSHVHRSSPSINNEMVHTQEDQERQDAIDQIELEAEDDIEDEQLKALIGWTEHYPETRARILEIIDELDVRISDMVANITGVESWIVWHVIKSGKDLILEKGEDFRITDWKRRMANGEWTHDDRE